MGRTFKLVLIKPSHYDDDGYVIQWLRSAIPSNSLACALRPRRGLRASGSVLGDDVEIDIHAFDETNTRVRPDRIARMIERGGRRHGRCWSACSRTSFRARSISRGRLRERGMQVAIGGFHVSGCICDAAGDDPDTRSRRRRLGISLFAGEAEGRLDEVLRDAYARRAQAALQLHERPAGHRGHADPAPRRAQRVRRTAGT